MSAYADPTLSQFKTRFSRDFNFGTTSDLVMDSDLTNAFQDAGTNINQELFVSQDEYQMAFLYLAAHHLCENLKAAQSGPNSTYSWMVQSKTASDISESYFLPEWVKNSKVLAYLTTTRYGAKYCSIIAPRLIGNFASSTRVTLP